MTTSTAAPELLSLVDLEAFDRNSPRPGDGHRERRFCCPLPACRDKARTASHRSLSVNTDTGEWLCFRCESAGVVAEKATPRASHPPLRGPAAQRHRLLRALAVPDVASPPPGRAESAARLPEMWAACAPLDGSAGRPATRYLEARGLSPEAAHRAGVRYARDWWGAPAVVYPVLDPVGELVAANGRYLTVREGQPKTRTCGDLKLGAFASPGAWGADPLVLVEGPADALALTALGAPAVALLGLRMPWWLPRRTFGRRVGIALDADTEGDRAAAALADELGRLGALGFRWRPPVEAFPAGGVKDWADLVRSEHGGPARWRPAVAAFLAVLRGDGDPVRGMWPVARTLTASDVAAVEALPVVPLARFRGAAAVRPGGEP